MTDRLVRLRDRARNQMMSILQFAEKLTEATTVEDANGRLEFLETKYEKFNELELQLFEDDSYQPITNAVDEIYHKARALLRKKGGHDRAQANTTQDLNNTLGQFISQQKTFYEGVNISQHVRLPKIDIEKFSGDYKQWASFHDLFVSTVHNNEQISGVHKLQMLKGILMGEAAALIRHIPITEKNYVEAWDKLCNRYNKMNPIVTSLIQTFFEQKTCVKANGRELRQLTETSDEVIRGLRALGPQAETRDPWIIHVLLKKLDPETRQMWANESVGNDFPNFDTLVTFLNKRCDALEISGASSKVVTAKSTSRSFLISNANTNLECTVCKQPHLLFRCPVFKNQHVNARSKLVDEKFLCRNCLRKGHVSEKCFSKSSCLICNKRHHTLLHHERPALQPVSRESSTNHHAALNEESILESRSTMDSTHTITDETHVLHTSHGSPTTILPTAIVNAKSNTGQLQPIRALLDSGSQTSFVTESCAQRLGLKRNQASITVHGLASTSAGQTRGRTDMTIYSRIDKTYGLNITAHIISNITNLLPKQSISIQKRIPQLQFADPQFFEPNSIDVLLGADVFFEILNPEKRIVDGLPILQSSKFGWLIAGTVNNHSLNTINFHATTGSVIQTNHEDLQHLLTKFWKVEEVGAQSNPMEPINSCEAYYEETTTRNTDGRFIVKLPFKNPRLSLGRSLEAAHQRQLAMERKFAKLPEFQEAYQTFINEYIQLGHMTQIPWNEVPEEDDAKYFLPHHAVIKASSSTTKLRVVFDASCKTSTQLSLNDILQTGPNIQTELSTILLRFRKHAIAIVADVEKMYRQILVTPEEKNFQLILWRKNNSEQLGVYKLNTVTYGTACAPFLAVKSLKSSTNTFEALYPKATQVIKNEFYIDDLLTGCDTVAEAILLKEQVGQILSCSGFSLRKWKSNSHEFLKSFPTHEIQNIPKLIEDDISIKTLGIIWNSDTDSFSFQVNQGDNNRIWTKRRILSTTSKVYDPMGWLAPTIILFKILMQKMWLLNIEWDSSLPNSIANAWQGIYHSLSELESIEIPRRLTTFTSPTVLQLHAFCDASEAAYGSVIYLRAINSSGEVTTNIIYAKSKVAPIKQISLPRLELCGATLLCQSLKFCIKSLSYQDIDVFAWTDSMIVLHWLSDVPRRWKSFVGNRTATILETVPRSKWQHVESKFNPADVITRGLKPQALAKSQIWWRGPHWLSQPESNWPKSKSPISKMDLSLLEERTKYTTVLIERTEEHEIIHKLLTKFTSWFKIRKVVVYIMRFGHPARRKYLMNQHTKTVTPIELNDAETLILRNVQQRVFKAEYATLVKRSTLSTKHHLSSLDPFIDSNGLIRVGGRLRKSLLSFSVKHPVILPKNHIICERIIHDVHIKHMHAGNSLTLSIIRNKYWMIGARYMIKSHIKSCNVCIRYRCHKAEEKMADLPAARCIQSRPFLKIGLDYAGPLYVKTSTRRNSPVAKAYVAVFVCLAVKAVHLEVVSSLDTDSFVAALKRFISRRGTPEQIWCDNGSNFIGANRELQQLKHQIINQVNNPLIHEFLLQKGIVFHFNPPHSPHFGGLWEAAVKSFKYHLKRVSNINLSFEEMTTLIIQIESLLNSRPLCKFTDDPTSLELLTPAHFLVGESLTAIPEPNLIDIPMRKLSRWQNIQQRLQGFWDTWHRDYLTSLQHRYKWKTSNHQFNIDDLVLIREDNLPPSQWVRGRIVSVHPGSDDLTRVVTLKTAKGEIRRPIHKLVQLVLKEQIP